MEPALIKYTVTISFIKGLKFVTDVDAGNEQEAIDSVYEYVALLGQYNIKAEPCKS